ncbi:MAG: protein-disulfide reductase DsbD, partial [Gammaproteobacteria bacterium]|nr:protein-disulfide reductase DsbD [Gammaproteobacteria bacterium]
MLNRFLIVLLVLLAGFTLPVQGQEDELLRPEQAFPVTAKATDTGVRLEWNIAEGYYLYRKRFRFRTEEPGVTLGEAEFPPGKIKEDEFFGKIEVYRGKLAVDIPLEYGPDVSQLALQVTSQGCADIGVCFPPHTETMEIGLDPPAPVGGGVLKALAGFGEAAGEEQEFLDPEQAFRFTAEVRDMTTMVASWDIAPGYYLYKDKFRFRLENSGDAGLGQAVFPPGKVKDDPLFGQVEVFFGRLEVNLPLQGAIGGSGLGLEVQYQGCAEAGICYPPVTKLIPLFVPVKEVQQTAVPDPGRGPPAVDTEASEILMVAEHDRLASLLISGNIGLAVAAFFGFGLLLAFTPCVFPMVPILSGIIVGQGSRITPRKAFSLSLTYVLAMSVTYTAAGVIAGLFGKNLQAILQDPWILSSFAVVFVLLALSMFGFYDLQLPSSWQSRLTEMSNRQRGGSLVGVAIMGFLSALIVGPCVAPPLAAALIVIGKTGDPWLGGLALFALSMGMGAPLVVMGTLEGKYLPRAGGWMNAVKAVFGVLLLGVAIYLLDRVLPGWLVLVLWASLFMISAIYMGALEPLGLDSSGFRKLWKGVGLVMLVYGILLMIGAASGGSDMFKPLKGVGLVAESRGLEGEREVLF